MCVYIAAAGFKYTGKSDRLPRSLPPSRLAFSIPSVDHLGHNACARVSQLRNVEIADWRANVFAVPSQVAYCNICNFVTTKFTICMSQQRICISYCNYENAIAYSINRTLIVHPRAVL